MKNTPPNAHNIQTANSNVVSLAVAKQIKIAEQEKKHIEQAIARSKNRSW